MSLPRIAPYPLPTEAQLPECRVTWPLRPRRAALLVHDMQRHFLAPFTPGAPPVPQLLANIGTLRERCAEAGVPVIFCAQPGGQTREQRGLLQDFWGDGIPDGPDAQAIADDLAPVAPGDVVTKWRYSAFVRTDLAERLRAHGRDQLVICGVYAHIGCLTTACDAFMHEIQPFVVGDAVADFSASDHAMALGWAARRCAMVVSTAHALAALAPEASTGGLDREGVRAALRAALEQPPARLADDDDLVDLGLDSMTLMGLVSEWRAKGAAVTFEDLAAAEPTLAAWWPVIAGARSGSAVA